MKKNYLFGLVFFIGLVAYTIVHYGGDNIRDCQKNNLKIKKEFNYTKINIDGNFYEMKNTAKIPYPWITARVDINRSNDMWENDVISLMKKNGWKNHPMEAKNLCKDGSKLILEQVVYSGKTYQFISLLHDDTTEDECE